MMRRFKGMTFLEVLIAIVIVGVVLSGMLTGLNFASRITRHNANKTIALNFAQELMEEIKDKDYEDGYATDSYYHTGVYTNYLGPELADIAEKMVYDDDDDPEDGSVTRNEFDDVDDYNGYPDTVNLYQKEGVNIQANRTVVIADQNGNSTLDSGGYANVTYKQITVIVSWDWWNKSYTEEVNTIVTEYH